MFCPSPDRSCFVLQGLAGIVNLLCRGRVAPSILPHLCGATLLACQKKGGGLRPIAVGEVLRRLTSKCVSRAVQADTITTLSPLQVGVAVPGGCEAVVHSVVSLINDSTIPPDSRCFLLVDFSNAFNSIDRKCMLRLGLVSPPCQPGLNVATASSRFYISATTLFAAAAAAADQSRCSRSPHERLVSG